MSIRTAIGHIVAVAALALITCGAFACGQAAAQSTHSPAAASAPAPPYQQMATGGDLAMNAGASLNYRG